MAQSTGYQQCACVESDYNVSRCECYFRTQNEYFVSLLIDGILFGDLFVGRSGVADC